MKEIISRKDAKENGITRYFTGKPCKRGHICERGVYSGCLECHALHERNRRIIHRDRCIAADMSRYRTNKTRFLSQCYKNIIHRCSSKAVYEPKNRYCLFIKCLIDRDVFIKWSMEDSGFNSAHKEWGCSGYQTRFVPSIDRIDNNGHYEHGNLQWLTLSDNVKKMYKERSEILEETFK